MVLQCIIRTPDIRRIFMHTCFYRISISPLFSFRPMIVSDSQARVFLKYNVKEKVYLDKLILVRNNEKLIKATSKDFNSLFRRGLPCSRSARWVAGISACSAALGLDRAKKRCSRSQKNFQIPLKSWEDVVSLAAKTERSNECSEMQHSSERGGGGLGGRENYWFRLGGCFFWEV